MRILLVEDDDILRDGIVVGLGLEGFEVDAVACLADARAAIGDHAGVVLDIGLPDGSGLDLLAEWRRAGVETPVLLLTARDMVTDRVEGLDRGADDYLGKPFDLTELSARLRAIMRRASGRASGDLELGALIISEARRSVALDGKEIAVSRREFAILHALAERPGHVLSRSQLEDRIYGWQEEIESNAVEVHIHKLRAKLGRTRIETVRGEGYRITRS
ncbi:MULTISPECIES: winged helix-turn-helix domain-containing protein [Sphingobium]|jgi:two-component system response regulator QseB|uniref:Response regulator n=1 Tax=Sphingobium psychrophilum TaxID=2728834 RepID=A0A7X9WSX0_9SPHN|nr:MULTISPECIES: winged helix-turn-helix domain-containing protein [Sphingobium]MBS86397.1 DNA-binding response regulator [Sphingobium sp.]MBS87390.1 DNA-binding response regulator [Sphingobium sp.]NML09213.1 response regulator [Sphingobium psychrophilum]OUC53135.1 DNA-binding response regulator [Sphingobium sp. GW456-12-10-14-TSB1]